MNYPVKTFKKRPAGQRETGHDDVRTASTSGEPRPSPNGRPWWVKAPHVRSSGARAPA